MWLSLWFTQNLAAMEEYQQRLEALERERQRERAVYRHAAHHHHQDEPPAAVAAHGGGRLHDANVDPDNMTYEELLQLGEDVGDVKKERWRRVAVQVLSRLPTHRWTTKSSDDISYVFFLDAVFLRSWSLMCGGLSQLYHLSVRLLRGRRRAHAAVCARVS
jgi:hypothetical protein